MFFLLPSHLKFIYSKISWTACTICANLCCQILFTQLYALHVNLIFNCQAFSNNATFAWGCGIYKRLEGKMLCVAVGLEVDAALQKVQAGGMFMGIRCDLWKLQWLVDDLPFLSILVCPDPRSSFFRSDLICFFFFQTLVFLFRQIPHSFFCEIAPQAFVYKFTWSQDSGRWSLVWWVCSEPLEAALPSSAARLLTHFLPVLTAANFPRRRRPCERLTECLTGRLPGWLQKGWCVLCLQ